MGMPKFKYKNKDLPSTGWSTSLGNTTASKAFARGESVLPECIFRIYPESVPCLFRFVLFLILFKF